MQRVLNGIERAQNGDMRVITKDKVWVNKETRQSVLVLYVSDELVTYQAADSQTPVPMRKFIFLQDFERLL